MANCTVVVIKRLATITNLYTAVFILIDHSGGTSPKCHQTRFAPVKFGVATAFFRRNVSCFESNFFADQSYVEWLKEVFIAHPTVKSFFLSIRARIYAKLY